MEVKIFFIAQAQSKDLKDPEGSFFIQQLLIRQQTEKLTAVYPEEPLLRRVHPDSYRDKLRAREQVRFLLG